MDWEPLGIEPTTDKRAITRAYRTQLMHTNPEDKPREFQELRAAYEQALALAARAEKAGEAVGAVGAGEAAGGAGVGEAAGTSTGATATSTGATDAGASTGATAAGASMGAAAANAAGESPAAGATSSPFSSAAAAAAHATTPELQWMEQVAAVYDNFQQRIDPNVWRALLSQDIVMALDSRPAIEEMLLLFLLHTGNLSQEVWQVLENTFKWSQRREELYETYPRTFVDRLLIEGAQYPSVLPLSLFYPGENASECDAYLDLFIQASHSEWEHASQFLDQIDELSEHHPYGDALRYHHMVAQGDGLGIIRLLALSQQYPQDAHLKEELAEAYADKEAWPQTEEIVRELLEHNRTDRRLTWLLAQALAGQKQYPEAIELLGDLMHAAGGDQKEIQELSFLRKEWNDILIEEYEQRLEQGDCSDRLLFELSWCYLQNERDQESLELMERIDRENIEGYEYYNLSSQVYLATEQYEKAFEHSKVLVGIVRAMQPDGTIRTEKRRARLAEMICRCGDCLYAQEDIASAMHYYEEAAELDPDNPERLTHYARVMGSLNRWSEAAEAASRLIEVMPGAYHAHFLLAQFYFEMHNDRDAFYHVNYALGLEKSDLSVYVLRLRILLRNGALEQAESELQFLENSNCGNYLPVLYCKALFAEATDAQNGGEAVALEPETGASGAGEADEADAGGTGASDGMDADTTDANAADAGTAGAPANTPAPLARGYVAARRIYQNIYERLLQGEDMEWPGQVCYRLALLSQEEGETAPDLPLTILNKGLELDPNDIDCLSFKAWLLMRLDQTEEAIEAYERLVDLPHTGVEPERALAQLYSKSAERNADKALKYSELVLKQEPHDPVALYYAGLHAYYVQNYALAESYFLQERAVEPNCPDSYRLLTFVYEAQGRFDEALRECEEYIRTSKKEKQLRINQFLRKVHVLRRAGRGRDAVETLLRASVKYAYDNVHLDVCDIFLQQGMFQELELYLQKWQQLNAQAGAQGCDAGGLAYAQALYELVVNNNPKRAEQCIEQGLYDMNDWQVFSAKCILSVYTGNYEQLEKCLRKRLDLKRAEGGFAVRELCDLAMAKWYQENTQAAVQYAQKAIKETDQKKTPYGTDRRRLLGEQAVMFALANHPVLARRTLQAAEEAPRCERCTNCACPELTLFKAQILLIQGDIATCCSLVSAARTKWPGDVGFACFEQLLKRGGFMLF